MKMITIPMILEGPNSNNSQISPKEVVLGNIKINHKENPIKISLSKENTAEVKGKNPLLLTMQDLLFIRAKRKVLGISAKKKRGLPRTRNSSFQGNLEGRDNLDNRGNQMDQVCFDDFW